MRINEFDVFKTQIWIYSECEFCWREFVHESELHSHIEIHQKENNVNCEFGELKKHVLLIHEKWNNE